MRRDFWPAFKPVHLVSEEEALEMAPVPTFVVTDSPADQRRLARWQKAYLARFYSVYLGHSQEYLRPWIAHNSAENQDYGRQQVMELVGRFNPKRLFKRF